MSGATVASGARWLESANRLQSARSGYDRPQGIDLRTDQHPAPGSRKATPSTWAVASTALFLLWVGTFYAARLLEYAPLASLWFPPSAVAFAAFAVLRLHALPALLAAIWVASWDTWSRSGLPHDSGDILYNAVLYAASHCLPYWLLAEGVLYTLGERQVPRSAPSIARAVVVFLLGGMLAATLAAVTGACATVEAGLAPVSERWPLLLPWLIGDYIGLLAFGPLLILALRRLAERLRLPCPAHLFAFDGLPRPAHTLGSFLRKLALTLSVAVLALVAIAQAPGNEPLLFVIFVAVVLQLWIVHTQSAVESLVSIALFSLTVVAVMAILDLDQVALSIQLALITLATASYFGLTVPVLYADNSELRRRLIRDGLTGAYSRHFFVDLSQRAILQARQRGAPVSMLMIDLDHLKAVNDRHGHAAGDHALVQIVDLCQNALGPNDLLGRLGGDEFCALLPGHDGAAAAAVARSLIDIVRASRFPFADDVHPGLSIGLASSQSPEDDYESLWLRADSALYVAKRSGRGQLARDVDD